MKNECSFSATLTFAGSLPSSVPSGKCLSASMALGLTQPQVFSPLRALGRNRGNYLWGSSFILHACHDILQFCPSTLHMWERFIHDIRKKKCLAPGVLFSTLTAGPDQVAINYDNLLNCKKIWNNSDWKLVRSELAFSLVSMTAVHSALAKASRFQLVPYNSGSTTISISCPAEKYWHFHLDWELMLMWKQRWTDTSTLFRNQGHREDRVERKMGQEVHTSYFSHCQKHCKKIQFAVCIPGVFSAAQLQI